MQATSSCSSKVTKFILLKNLALFWKVSSWKFYSLAGKFSFSLEHVAILWKILFWKFCSLDRKFMFYWIWKRLSWKTCSFFEHFSQPSENIILTKLGMPCLLLHLTFLFLFFKNKGSSLQNQGIRKIVSLKSLMKLTRSHKRTNPHWKIYFRRKKLQGTLGSKRRPWDST